MTLPASGSAFPTTWRRPPATSPSGPPLWRARGPILRTCTLLALTAVSACGSAEPEGPRDQVGAAIGSTSARRIVALAPDVVELVCALGRGDRLAGVSSAADYPPFVRTLPKVAGNDAEAILALNPDLVVATTSGNDARVIDRLRATGTPVFVADVTSFARLAEAATLLGAAVHAPDAGRRLASGITARVAAVVARAASLPRRFALFVVWWDPLIVAGRGTFHDDLLRQANLVNLASGGAGRYPRAAPELLLDPKLEVVVCPDEPVVREGYARILRTPAGTRLGSGAVKVDWLPADLANRPGPRLPDALDRLVAEREARQ